MVETFSGKIQLAKLTQQLDDHIVTQSLDMSEVKSGLSRIESKLDLKANRDEIDKIAQLAERKADKSDVADLNKRFWGLISVMGVTLLGFIVYVIEQILISRLK